MKVWKYLKHVFVFGAALAIVTAANKPYEAKADTKINSRGRVIYKSADGEEMIQLYASDIRYLKDELDRLFAELE